MRRTSSKYKKWQLHTQNQWPPRASEHDPLVQMWWQDRHLNALEWGEQAFIPSAEWHKAQLSARSYIDYLQCSELCADLQEGWTWMLLNSEGRVVHAQSSADMADKLELLGIKVGFSFAKEQVGTTAFSIAQTQQSVAILQWDESYMKALHNFASVCVHVQNSVHGYYVMLLLEEQHEALLSACANQMVRIAQRPSSNLRYLSMFEHMMKVIDSMVVVFDANNEIIYKNHLAECQSNNKGLLLADRQVFAFSELSSIDGKRQFKRYFGDQIVHISVMRNVTEQGSICFISMSTEAVERDEWKRDIAGEIINKDSFLEKISTQKAKSGLRLLVTAEVGSGENYVVRFLQSKRQNKSSFHIDCLAGFSADTANQSAKLRFLALLQRANEHMLHIENIDHLSVELQGVLLKCLSSGMVEDDAGQLTPLHIDLICTASRKSDWQQSRISRMLFHMLSVNQLDLKPIHSDSERLEQAIHTTLASIGYRERRLVSIDSDAMDQLLKYRWPGNFLELFQVIENALLISNDGVITPDLLPERLLNKEKGIQSMMPVRDAERGVIISAWREHNGKVTRVACALGMSRTTLWRKMKKLGLDSQLMAMQE